MAIFMHKELTEALINLLKHDAKIPVLLKATAWFLFEVNW